jgi:hypothetical protein
LRDEITKLEENTKVNLLELPVEILSVALMEIPI